MKCPLLSRRRRNGAAHRRTAFLLGIVAPATGIFSRGAIFAAAFELQASSQRKNFIKHCDGCPKVANFRFAQIRSRIDANSDHFRACSPMSSLDEHLHHVHTRPAFHLQRIKKLLPDHEGYFDHRAFAEDERHTRAPTPREELAIEGHRSMRTHAGHYIGVTNRLDEERKIGWMKLFVRGDQADHLLGCSLKASVQRAAIAAWTR